MVNENDVIAIIIITLFIVLAIVAYLIYTIQNRVHLFARGVKEDEELADD